MPVSKALRVAKIALGKEGLTINLNVHGEYRVAFAGTNLRETEPSAYYTDDIVDAVNTGLAMAEAKKLQSKT